MKKKSMYISIFLLLFAICFSVKMDSNAASAKLVSLPEGFSYYAKTSAPVYAVPDMQSIAWISLDIDTKLNVTGYLDTGYFLIDLGGTYYVPAIFVRMQSDILTPDEAYKQLLQDIADAYFMQLETSRNTIGRFGLKDLTGDGIPELISESGHEVYTFYDGKPVMLYYTETDMTYYYSQAFGLCAANYHFAGNENWQIFQVSKALLPWGQFVAAFSDLNIYPKEQFKKVTCNYINDANTRQKLYETLYSLAIAGSL